ncbi:hypothetical protein [Flavobacterium aquatile]|uniref:Lipoprotein n=1 Tax=Flavobacterium aquatile LMG 4008 = ATCC 11947 TaxID=1453498 RepID=A0A095U2F5_9FLAO|nr:hypothetical protein [Flavobacterium aquatile]KGD68778.1 hypothetical protein LG45_03795 [Flavobacterium aquatile LMG 4008 = ATCC 11947]OXA69198.1 hypothetical protein B0A61_01425 [Flavobacterium aquatile LMG 4008 = ATCC 11947]GEC79051.1 hypothetical protein FAQ01_19210 [Flavobacterium aquatile]
MKKFITTLYLSASFFLISCNKDPKTNVLVVDIDAVIQTTDSINTYYTTNNSIEFNDPQSFWTKVKGSKKNQKIQITFPDSIQPNQIRLDFGRNIKQPEIIVNEMKFSYKKKSFDAKGEEVYFLFRVDESNTTVNKLTGSLKRKEKTQIVGPSLYPNGDKLYKKLNQLYSEKLHK